MSIKRHMARDASQRRLEIEEHGPKSKDEEIILYLFDELGFYHKRVESLVHRKTETAKDDSLDEVFQELETVQGILMDILLSLRTLGFKDVPTPSNVAKWALLTRERLDELEAE